MRGQLTACHSSDASQGVIGGHGVHFLVPHFPGALDSSLSKAFMRQLVLSRSSSLVHLDLAKQVMITKEAKPRQGLRLVSVLDSGMGCRGEKCVTSLYVPGRLASQMTAVEHQVKTTKSEISLRERQPTGAASQSIYHGRADPTRLAAVSAGEFRT